MGIVIHNIIVEPVVLIAYPNPGIAIQRKKENYYKSLSRKTEHGRNGSC